MTTLLNEQKILLSTVAKNFPGSRGSENISPITVYRWATRGTKTPDGRIVRLESFRIGNRLMTTLEAVERYVSALTHPYCDETISRTPTKRRVDDSAAARSLASRIERNSKK